MGNRRAREFMLQRERDAEDAEWAQIKNQPRPAHHAIGTRGIGVLRLQLIVCPSFEESRAWEVRQGPEDWRLFQPSVVHSVPDVQLVGYDPIPFKSEKLKEFFEQVISLTLPIKPDLSGYLGADGTFYQLAVFGDRWSEWRFQWWSDPPDQWRPLVSIANQMIRVFLAAEGQSPDLFDD